MREQLIAGDALDFETAVPDYPASDGWVLTYKLIPVSAGGTVYTITATTADDGESYAVEVSSATTANWTAGEYTWAAYVTLSGERHVVDPEGMCARLTIKSNPATATSAWDVRSATQKAYDDCLVAMADAAARSAALGTSGNTTGAVIEYTIGERRIRYDSASEAYTALVTMRSALGVELQRERAAAALRRGDYDPRRVYLRVNRV